MQMLRTRGEACSAGRSAQGDQEGTSQPRSCLHPRGLAGPGPPTPFRSPPSLSRTSHHAPPGPPLSPQRPLLVLTLVVYLQVRNFNNPYPSEAEKTNLVRLTGVSLKQINNWMSNARVRIWRPAVQILKE
eukprot:762558-Hanusia_phi.AAC.1